MLDWLHRFRFALRACVFHAAGAAGEQVKTIIRSRTLIPIALQAALGERKEVAIFGTDYPTPDGTACAIMFT